MAKSVNDFWIDIQKKGNFDSHGYYRLKDINMLPSTPGIYSWYITGNQSNVDNFYKLFMQKRVAVSIEGHLKEIYQGNLRRHYDEGHFKTGITDFGLFNVSSLAFCPPLYIGISKDLKSRINVHYQELQKIIDGRVKLKNVKVMNPSDFDTIYESQHFAQRIGYSIKTTKRIKLNSIFIKTIEMQKGYSWGSLNNIEKYLNRAFVPIYGRK